MAYVENTFFRNDKIIKSQTSDDSNDVQIETSDSSIQKALSKYITLSFCLVRKIRYPNYRYRNIKRIVLSCRMGHTSDSAILVQFCTNLIKQSILLTQLLVEYGLRLWSCDFISRYSEGVSERSSSNIETKTT